MIVDQQCPNQNLAERCRLGGSADVCNRGQSPTSFGLRRREEWTGLSGRCCRHSLRAALP